MEILKIVITLLLQISLIAVAQNSTQNENNHDKITQLNLSTESDVTTIVPKLLENSTIQSTDNSNLMSATLVAAEKLFNDTEPQTTLATTTTTIADMLIPPATVEAQIEKIDVTSQKPSRLASVIAAQ